MAEEKFSDNSVSVVRPFYDQLRVANKRTVIAPRCGPRSQFTVRGFDLPFQIYRLRSRRGTEQPPITALL
jgi:hypothetical protein